MRATTVPSCSVLSPARRWSWRDGRTVITAAGRTRASAHVYRMAFRLRGLRQARTPCVEPRRRAARAVFVDRLSARRPGTARRPLSLDGAAGMDAVHRHRGRDCAPRRRTDADARTAHAARMCDRTRAAGDVLPIRHAARRPAAAAYGRDLFDREQ